LIERDAWHGKNGDAVKHNGKLSHRKMRKASNEKTGDGSSCQGLVVRSLRIGPLEGSVRERGSIDKVMYWLHTLTVNELFFGVHRSTKWDSPCT
jgi:hypothetical protein